MPALDWGTLLCRAITVVALMPTPGAGQAVRYRIIDLGTLGGSTSYAAALNNRRQVTGNALVASDPGATGSLLRSYRWSGDRMSPLGDLPTTWATSTNRFSRGCGINDSGVVVGEFDNDSPHAFVFADGRVVALPNLAGSLDRGVARDINNSGLIVGSSSNGRTVRPTRWTWNGTSSSASDLGTPDGTETTAGRAVAINESGVVVGATENTDGTTQATVWESGVARHLRSLGDGSTYSEAVAVNASGVIVGASFTGGTVGEVLGTSSTTPITRAVRWSGGIPTALAPVREYSASERGPTSTHHSVARDINDAGAIVGNSQRVAGMAAIATLWERGTPADLNRRIPDGSGWVLQSAEGINAAGDIVGYGTFNGATRAFLLIRLDQE